MRAFLLAALLVACSSPTIAPRDCTPGTTSACVCAAAQASGVQVCTAAGTLGACVCADAGTVLPDAGVSAEDRPAGIDAVTVSRPDVWMGTDPVTLEDRPDVSAVAGDASVCQLRGEGELPRRRCASAADCRGCAELVPGYEWCCGLAGYCENRPPGQCTGDAGIYTPDAPRVNCDRFDWGVRCRTHQDCQAVCEPAGVNRLMWCCHPNGICNPTRAATCS